MNIRDELLTRARNLERYPFESATMAEAGRLAASHLREAARSVASGAHNMWIVDFDVLVGLPISDEGFGYVTAATICRARDSDGTASAALCEDIAVPQDCQARPSPNPSHRPIRRENNG